MNYKQAILLTIIASLCYSIYHLTTPTSHPSFQSWKSSYSKTYSPSQQSYRMSIWLKNLQYVNNHNQRYNLGQQTYQLQMNMFADLPSQQFKARYLAQFEDIQQRKIDGLTQTKACNGKQASSDNLPQSIDWSSKGAVTAVKNQGQCGSCWSFSTTGSLQAAHYQQKSQLISFSQQQLVDCSKHYGNHGCLGGLMNYSFWYVKDHGITTQSKYPYHGVGLNQCHYDQNKDQVWTINDCTEIPVNKQLAFRAAVAQQPVSVAIQANHMSFQLYKAGVYTGNCGEKLDHGVLTVGYGVEKGVKYWKVKNSWGQKWGMQGYILIQNTGDGAGKCGIQLAASVPIA